MILKNRQILITRDARQAASLTKDIERHGGTAICFPTIAITGPESWEQVDEALSHLSDYDWIVFTSANSVKFFVNRMRSQQIEYPAARIAAIGSKTNNLLQEAGLTAQLVPENFTAASLLESFEHKDVQNKRFLLPVSDIAREELYNGLQHLGTHVDRLVVYQNRLNEPDNKDEVLAAIQSGEIDVLTFFSPSAVFNFAEIVDQHALDTVRESRTAIAVIGPTTADAVRKLGLKPHIEPEKSTSEDLLNALLDYYQNPKE